MRGASLFRPSVLCVLTWVKLTSGPIGVFANLLAAFPLPLLFLHCQANDNYYLMIFPVSNFQLLSFFIKPRFMPTLFYLIYPCPNWPMHW